MADENPTGVGDAVALTIPAEHRKFLRETFEMARKGIRDELRDHPDDLKDPDRLHREGAAYARLLAALDKLVIVSDVDVCDVVGDLAVVIDHGNEYPRVVVEHEALHGLLDQLKGGEGR